VAEGIRILRPLRGDAVLAAVEASDGTWVAVDEDPIEEGRQALAQQGLYVEPTSAVVWPALIELGERLRPPIVAVLTGSGFKAGLRPDA
jgi:threonine synthase